MSSDHHGTADAGSGIVWVAGVGASRGAGAAIARRFAKEGYTVAVTGRTAGSLHTIVDEIESFGGKGLAIPGDVQKEGDLLEIVAGLEARGPIEVGVYNAGNALWRPPLETTTADFEAVWRVGCLGGFMFAREVARVMCQRARGTLLFTGATASLRGRGASTAFAAAKAGLRSVSQSFAREFGPQGIHVAHVIIDGAIHGEKILTRFPDIESKKGPDGLLSPEAIADAYWYLHTQDRSAWSQELDLRPYVESF
jgi:NAD(P)-dependent dehydrogenase (short-subunit alcohol dehydrogenase family)